MYTIFLQLRLPSANQTLRRKEQCLTTLHGAIRISIQANLIHQVPFLLTLALKIICVLHLQCPFLPRLIRVLLIPFLVLIHILLLILLLDLIHILFLIPVIPTVIRINLIPRTIPVTLFPVTRLGILLVTQRIFRHPYQIHSEILILRTLLAEHMAQQDTAIIHSSNTFWHNQRHNHTYPDKRL